MVKETRKQRERKSHIRDILSAASSLVANKGINQVSMDEIARAAEFGKGTLYNYFKSKDDLVWSLIDDIRNQYLALINSSMASSLTLQEKIRSILTISFDFQERVPAVTEILHYVETKMKDAAGDGESKKIIKVIGDFHKVFSDVFQRAVKTGEIGKVDTMRLSVVMFSSLLSFIRLRKAGILKGSCTIDINFILKLFFKKSNSLLT